MADNILTPQEANAGAPYFKFTSSLDRRVRAKRRLDRLMFEIFGTPLAYSPHRRPTALDRERIMQSTMPVADLAHLYGITVQLVQTVRAGMYGDASKSRE